MKNASVFTVNTVPAVLERHDGGVTIEKAEDSRNSRSWLQSLGECENGEN